jgi:hypothetical protein
VHLCIAFWAAEWITTTAPCHCLLATAPYEDAAIPAGCTVNNSYNAVFASVDDAAPADAGEPVQPLQGGGAPAEPVALLQRSLERLNRRQHAALQLLQGQLW